MIAPTSKRCSLPRPELIFRNIRIPEGCRPAERDVGEAQLSPPGSQRKMEAARQFRLKHPLGDLCDGLGDRLLGDLGHLGEPADLLVGLDHAQLLESRWVRPEFERWEMVAKAGDLAHDDVGQKRR